MADQTSTNISLGIDVGGTKIAVVALSSDGTVLDRFRRPTDADGGAERIVDDVMDCVEHEFSELLPDVTAAGIGVAGIVNREEGILKFAPNLGLKNTPIGAMLSDRIGRPVLVLNDVDAATYGEWKHGAAQGSRQIIGAFLGTGVGGSVIINGRLLEGGNSSAGEIGHMPIIEGGRRCSCGNQGCVEAYAGGWAIGERAREQVNEQPERGRRLVEIAGSREDITSETVSNAVSSGDPLAQEIVKRTGEILGAWVSGLVNVFNPNCFLLGGSVGEGFPQFMDAIDQHVRAHSLEAFQDEFNVKLAQLGDRAVAIGAAARARRQQRPNK
jgi:glucokinase